VPDEVRICDEMTIPAEHKKMFFQTNAEPRVQAEALNRSSSFDSTTPREWVTP